jgi:8-oxo-dGTP pyrophosphatase MutT (NUDIX family)
MKYAVQAVIFNEVGEVLAVSRKEDHRDFGLPGGKVDPEDNGDFKRAICREIFEETGIYANYGTLELVLSMHMGGYMGYTYLVHDWHGEINTTEPHVVKWAPFQVIKGGSFGEWNKLVARSLNSMGVDFIE